MPSLKQLLGLSRDDAAKAEHRRERKRLRNLSGGADVWPTYDFFVRAQAREIIGLPDPRCFTLQSVIRSLAKVEGDVAECGVRYGKSTLFLLEADQRSRTYHLFDSFAGLSEPTAEDSISATGRAYWVKGEIAVPETEARANLAAYPNVRFHPGWIPDRFPEVQNECFALVHVDVDLYRPTLDSLAFFWPRLVPGGMLVCDDYGFSSCPGAKQAVDEFFAGQPVSLVELTTGQVLVSRRAA